MKHCIFFLLWVSSLTARQIDTFYGPVEVEEPVLLELIDSPAFQRLKEIHQYGVSYYTVNQAEYNRYDHSIGVFVILRAHGASLEEQIAGLLHDVSHTAFSHVGDWIFGKENQESDYQNEIHSVFLEKSGLAVILGKYNLSVGQILPEEALFPALENQLPNLCADRIDYNIQGAYHEGFITYEEAIAIFNDIRFIEGRWVSHELELMKKLTRHSLFMSQGCWGSPANALTSRWLADAILRGIEIGCITYDDLNFGTDQFIWDILLLQNDPEICLKLEMLLNHQNYFSVIDSFDESDLVIKSKFRGINPWIMSDSQCLRLTDLDEEIAEEFEQVKRLMQKGWPVKMIYQAAI